MATIHGKLSPKISKLDSAHSRLRSEAHKGALLKLKRNHRASAAALFAVVMAVVLLAMPGRAHAGTVTLSQSDFDKAGGFLELTSSDNRTYVLSGNVVGSVDIYATKANAILTLDLNGYTLRSPASNDRIAVSITVPSNSAKSVTVKNGAIIQESENKVAIRTELSGFNRQTYLINLSVTATNQPCFVDEAQGNSNILGGSYETMNTGSSNASVIVNNSGKTNISDGARITLSGGDAILSTRFPYTDGIWLKDCSFSQAPAVSGIIADSSQVFYKPKGASEYWQVIPGTEELKCRADCNWYVTCIYRKDILTPIQRYWYFEDQAEGQAFQQANSGTFKELYTLIFTFSFNPDNGDLPTKYTVHYGDVVSRDQFNDGNDPVYFPYVFNGWKRDGKTDYDFSSKIIESVTVNASWIAPAATINSSSYLTLKEAIEAAGSGDTIVLFRNITLTDYLSFVDKGGVRLDLNGKTITYSGSGCAFMIQDSNLTVSDSSEGAGGLIDSSAKCFSVNSGVLSLEGGTFKSSTTVAVEVTGGSLSISGGIVRSDSLKYDVKLLGGTGTISGGYLKNSVALTSNTDLRITGGTFGDNSNKPSVSKGYHMLLGSDGRYAVSAHTWPNSYTYNGNGTHSRTCTADGCNETESASCWGTTATCVSGRVCYGCGATYTEPDPENHVGASEDWTTSATKHWHTCTGCGDVYPGTEADHTFVWVVDVEPTISSEGEEHEECSVCEYKSGQSRSIPRIEGSAPVISGLVEGVSYDGVTTFTVTDPDGDLASVVAVSAKGTETLTPAADGKYTLPNVDGEIEVCATDANDHQAKVKVSSYKDHDWSEWKSLGGTHERTCSHNGCTVGSQREACTGGEATCSKKAVCDTCHGEYGTLAPTNHTSASTDWATNESKHWHACNGCGEVYPDTEALHTFRWVVDVEPTVTSEGLEHEECSICGYKSGNTHVIPKRDGNVPVISGLVEGTAYDGVTTFTVSDPDGDLASVTANGQVLEADGDGRYTLPNLGKDIEILATDDNGNTAKVKVSSYDDHDWSDWVSLGNGTHERSCRHNGCTVKVERGDCTGGTATCVTGARCEVCGATYTDVDPNNHVHLGDWEHDDDAHWLLCSDCGTVVDKCDHEFEDRSDDAYTWRECVTCGFVTDKTEKPDSGDDDDKGDDSGDDDKGDEPDKDGKGDKDDPDSTPEKAAPADGETLPATGDPLACIATLAFAGAAVVVTGVSRRKR